MRFQHIRHFFRKLFCINASFIFLDFCINSIYECIFMHKTQLYWSFSYEYHSDISVIKPQHIVIQLLNIPYSLGMI